MSELPKSYTGPGLVDLQINGYAGLDFNGDPAEWTAERFHGVGEMLAGRGVMVALPTLITDGAQAMIARVHRYRELVDVDDVLAARFPRLHIEGPFISPVDGPRGAHPKAHCKTPAEMPDLIDRLREASGDRIGIFTLAPELDGACELIARLVEEGICPAIGHTQAGPDQIADAVSAGAKLATHLGNGSDAVLPRLDNYVQSQLADDRLAASFIADGHHIPFGTLKNFIRAKTVPQSVLVSDAIFAAEMPPGGYRFAGGEVVVRQDGRCTVPGQQHLAGSTLTLDRAVINAFLHCGVSFDEAWAMASTRPAAVTSVPVPEAVTVTVAEGRFVRV